MALSSASLSGSRGRDYASLMTDMASARRRSTSSADAIAGLRRFRFLSLQAEHEQHRRRRVVPQFRRGTEHLVAHGGACQDRDVLLAVDREGDGRRVNAGADVEAPHFLQCPRVIGRERPVIVAEKYEVAGGGERARIVRIGKL